MLFCSINDLIWFNNFLIIIDVIFNPCINIYCYLEEAVAQHTWKALILQHSSSYSSHFDKQIYWVCTRFFPLCINAHTYSLTARCHMMLCYRYYYYYYFTSVYFYNSDSHLHFRLRERVKCTQATLPHHIVNERCKTVLMHIHTSPKIATNLKFKEKHRVREKRGKRMRTTQHPSRSWRVMCNNNGIIVIISVVVANKTKEIHFWSLMQ